MSSTPNKILLKPNTEGLRPMQDDRLAAVALTPGELLDINASNKLIPHGGAAGGAAQKLWCNERPWKESATVAGIDQDYVADDTVVYFHSLPGDLIYAWLADGEDVDAGDPLVSDGAGALEAPTAVDATLVAGAIVAYADEAVAASGARARIKVRSA